MAFSERETGQHVPGKPGYVASKIALASWLLVLACVSGGCMSPGEWLYVGKLARAQLSMSLHSRPMTEAIASEDGLTQEEKEKLTLVLEVKEFCEEVGLNTSKVYDSYSSVGDMKLFLVVASERLRFELHQWNWPIIGPLPYKGFFNEVSAAREAQRLVQKGLDVYVGRASGYSTLGWFSDPFLPTMLGLDELSLIELVIHETTHRNIFKKGFSSFNEGVATLIAGEGTVLFVRKKFGPQSSELRTLQARVALASEEERQVNALYRELNDLYACLLPAEEKIARREEILAAHRPALAHKVEPADLNNAWILLRRTYTQHLKTYRKVHAILGNNLRHTIRFFKEVAASPGDPNMTVSEWLAETVTLASPPQYHVNCRVNGGS